MNIKLLTKGIWVNTFCIIISSQNLEILYILLYSIYNYSDIL